MVVGFEGAHTRECAYKKARQMRDTHKQNDTHVKANVDWRTSVSTRDEQQDQQKGNSWELRYALRFQDSREHYKPSDCPDGSG